MAVPNYPKKSEGTFDGFWCDVCEALDGPVPAFWFADHESTDVKSYDTGWVTKSRSSETPIQAEWTGYVSAETGGNKYGKYAKAELQDWVVWAGVKDVEYVP